MIRHDFFELLYSYMNERSSDNIQAQLKKDSTYRIFAVSEKYARGLCSGLGEVSRRENHGVGEGYWYHYHVKTFPNAHCWFIG